MQTDPLAVSAVLTLTGDPGTPAQTNGAAQARHEAPRPRFSGPGHDRILSYHLAEGTAGALRLASPTIKRLAAAGRISPKRASAWWCEGRGNPVYDVTLLLYHLAQDERCSAEAVLAHFQVTVEQARAATWSVDQVIAEFWRLMDAEPAADGEQKLSAQRFGRGEAEDLEAAHLREAAVQIELVALKRDLDRRRVDPRQGRAA
jgi:hypothetical protein